MTDLADAAPSLPQAVSVVNIGLPLFADSVAAQGADVVSVDWRVPAGGQPEAVAALGRLYGADRCGQRRGGAPPGYRHAAADRSADGSRGRARPAGSHAAALRSGYRLRRRARSAAQVNARCRGHAGLGSGTAGSARAARSRRDRAESRERAPISQGTGDVAWFGCDNPAAIARLGFLRDVAAPVIRQLLELSGPLDVLALAAQAVAMGDDIHVRTQAATNLLIREWLPHLAGLADPARVAFARFLSGNHLFFLTIAMAAARSLTEWAGQVQGASIVTTMARNGTTFGIRLAGSDQWFTAGAPEVGHALYYPDQGPQTSARDIGDSAVLELTGLGAAAAAGSPAVAQLLGGSMDAAAALTGRLAAVCAGQSGRFKIPALEMAGTPLGVDVRRVVELGVTPAITTGILHRSAGTGQVGAGVAEAPIGCFADALADLDMRLSRR